MANPRFNKQTTNVRGTVSRVKRAMGGMSNARKDMASGYYKDDMGMKGGAMYKTGGRVKKKNGSRVNDIEELGRVDSEKAFTKSGKKNLKAEKKRIIKKLNKA
tara:strand:- start:167 stop:475 length:309 start_codon:yes stop_codon:yes gene_type:complete